MITVINTRGPESKAGGNQHSFIPFNGAAQIRTPEPCSQQLSLFRQLFHLLVLCTNYCLHPQREKSRGYKGDCNFFVLNADVHFGCCRTLLKARAKPSPKKTEVRFPPKRGVSKMPKGVRGLARRAKLRATEHRLRSLIEMDKYGLK